MIGLGAILSVSGVVDHQDAIVVGSGGWIRRDQFQSALIHRFRVPGRLAREELQLLDVSSLGTDYRLGADQTGQGLVSIPGQQQSLQVGAKAPTLGQGAEQVIELEGVVLQGTGHGRTDHTLSHGRDLRPPRSAIPLPKLTKYR